MQNSPNQKLHTYINARREHPAWRLLASQTAPSVLSTLQQLFDDNNDGVEFEVAIAQLSPVLQAHSQTGDLDIGNDFSTLASKELRQWIRRGLVVERKGKINPTDALQKAFSFVDGLNQQLMTSTASRLSTVQREIENLESNLNPDASSRTSHIKRKIQALEDELAAVEAGHFKVLSGDDAVESIREVYHLASSLRADFRRVEDSYREADKQLRQSIISDQQHRGDVVDKLLNSHDQLLDTAEGRVFHNFHQQLSRTIELDNMAERLKIILQHPQSQRALDRQQQQELRWLKLQLVMESESVIKARARSERDVKGFLKTGLAAEHHRVGQLLQQLLAVAVDVDWSSQSVRRADSPIAPVAVACSSVPLVERLRFKTPEDNQSQALDLSQQHTSLDDIDADFWTAFDSLNREEMINKTFDWLQRQSEPVSVAELANHFTPDHDLETIALWLSLAREAELPITDEQEHFELHVEENISLRYSVPKVAFTAEAINTIEREDFEG